MWRPKKYARTYVSQDIKKIMRKDNGIYKSSHVTECIRNENL